MKRCLIFLSLVLWMLPLVALGQAKRSVVYGTVVDDASTPLIQAAVQLLSVKDSSMVEGVVTRADGFFRIQAHPGDYILKASFIGLDSQCRNIHIPVSAKELPVGMIRLLPDNLYLESATVTAKAQAVVVKEDTVIYNAAAYRVEEGAMVDALIKKIPGMQVDAKGNVSLHGKPIRRLYLNGKQFFGENVRTGLKNIPAEMIENIKAYEIPSEMSQIAGVDDGDAEPVLDLSVRKDQMGDWRVTLNGGGGVSRELTAKYRAKANASKITKQSHTTVVGSADNIGDRAVSSTTSRYVVGCGSRGYVHERELGANFSGEKKGFKWGSNVHYDGNNADSRYNSRSETILVAGNYFSETDGMNILRPNKVSADGDFEWRPDKKTRILFKPQLSFQHQVNETATDGSSFALDSSIINHTIASTMNKTSRADADVTFTLSRQLAKRGRSAWLYSRIHYTHQGQNYSSFSNIRYYKIKSNPDSTRIVNTLYDEHNGTFNTTLLGGWNEPVSKVVHLQFILREEYYSSSRNRDFLSDPQLSSEGQYRFLATVVQANVRLLYKNCKYTLGVQLKPQNTWLRYLEGAEWRQKGLFLFNAAPNISINYTPSKTHKLSLSYTSWSGQPSLYNLVPVASGTNPQYLHFGNPDLKPSFTHKALLSYNFSNPKAQNSLVGTLQWRLVENATCNSTVFDPETGSRTITPVNVAGNWNLSGSLAYNESFRQSPFALMTNLSWDYKNDVSYLYNNKIKADELNTVHRLMARLSVNGSYKGQYVELGLGLDGSYIREESLLRAEMNRDPWTLSPTASALFYIPGNVRLSTDLEVLFQRGFFYKDLNRNYYIWNASVSWTFLKKTATLKLDACDILHQLPDLGASFSSTSRSLTTYRSYNSYILLSLIWRFTM